jgi:hypothetical protein
MQAVTIPHIVERLQQLLDERLLVVDGFVSYLADREAERNDHKSRRVERLEQHHRRLQGFLMCVGVSTAGSRVGAGLRRRVNRPPTHVQFHKHTGPGHSTPLKTL